VTVWLEIETWVIHKGGDKRWDGKGKLRVEEVWELTGFGDFVCVWL
jgi:hypothetical protein